MTSCTYENAGQSSLSWQSLPWLGQVEALSGFYFVNAATVILSSDAPAMAAVILDLRFGGQEFLQRLIQWQVARQAGHSGDTGWLQQGQVPLLPVVLSTECHHPCVLCFPLQLPQCSHKGFVPCCDMLEILEPSCHIIWLTWLWSTLGLVPLGSKVVLCHLCKCFSM